MVDDEQLMSFDVHTLGMWERTQVLRQYEVVLTTTLDLLGYTNGYVCNHGWWYANRDDSRCLLTPVKLLVDGIDRPRRQTQVVDVRRQAFLHLSRRRRIGVVAATVIVHAVRPGMMTRPLGGMDNLTMLLAADEDVTGGLISEPLS